MKKLLLGSCIMIGIGALAYAFHMNYIRIIISYATPNITTKPPQMIPITLYFVTSQDTYHTEKISCLPQETPTPLITHIITQWLKTNPLTVSAVCSHCALSFDAKLLCIHFSEIPFHESWSTYQKLTWLQGLLRTIAEHNHSIEYVYFLVGEKQLSDAELDFSQPWPISGFVSI